MNRDDQNAPKHVYLNNEVPPHIRGRGNTARSAGR